VNLPMIRNGIEAISDDLPVYTDAEFAPPPATGRWWPTGHDSGLDDAGYSAAAPDDDPPQLIYGKSGRATRQNLIQLRSRHDAHRTSNIIA